MNSKQLWTHRCRTVFRVAALSFLVVPIAGSRAHDTPSSHEHNQVAQHQAYNHYPSHLANGNVGSYERSLHLYTIPDVTLTDMDGTKVSLMSELSSESPTIVNFIFTTCSTICPVLSATFAQAQKRLEAQREEFRMISISIDPEQDTPARLKAYADKHNAGPHWHFYTGNLADIVTVQKAFDAYRGNKMSHEPFTLLRASSNDSWVRLDGFTSAADLVAEYRMARMK